MSAFKRMCSGVNLEVEKKMEGMPIQFGEVRRTRRYALSSLSLPVPLGSRPFPKMLLQEITVDGTKLRLDKIVGSTGLIA